MSQANTHFSVCERAVASVTNHGAIAPLGHGLNTVGAAQRKLPLGTGTAFKIGDRVAVYAIERGAITFEGWAIIRRQLDIPQRYNVQFGDSKLLERWVYYSFALSDVYGFIQSMNSICAEIISSLFDAVT